MLSEFKRLQGTRAGVEELLDEGLKKYESAIQKLFGSAKKLEDVHQKALDNIPLQRDEIARKGQLVLG